MWASPGNMNSVTQTALFLCVYLLSFLSHSPPPWPPLFIHLSPSPPLCPSFCRSSLSSLCNSVLKNASGRQSWIDPDSRRIDGTLLQSGDHTEREREKQREGGTLFPPLRQWGLGWGCDDEERWRTRGAKLSLRRSSCHSSPHCSKLPTSWLDVTCWTFLLEAHTERQDTNVMHCTANRLTMLPIFSLVAVLLQNDLH